LAEERQKVQKERFLSFKKQGDQTIIRGSLPYLEGSEMEKQIRKIADRLYLGQADRPTPSARMLDALLIFMKYNPSNSYAESTATPVVAFDEEPFPETPTEPNEPTDLFGNTDRTHAEQSVNVFTSDTRMIIHWNATHRNRELRKRTTDRPSPAPCFAVRRNTRSATPRQHRPTNRSSNHGLSRKLATRPIPRTPRRTLPRPTLPGIGKTQARHLFELRADRITDTKFMINMCNYDHGQHHDGIIKISGDPEGVITFTYPDGR
jgi:hypothetical protein